MSQRMQTMLVFIAPTFLLDLEIFWQKYKFKLESFVIQCLLKLYFMKAQMNPVGSIYLYEQNYCFSFAEQMQCIEHKKACLS